MAKDMNETNGDPLELLLRDWADRHAADSGSLDRIQGAIGQAMEHGDKSQITDMAVAAPGRWQSRALWFAIGAVAALLLAMVSVRLWQLRSPQRPEIARHPSTQRSGEVPAAITPDQLARDTKLFAAAALWVGYDQLAPFVAYVTIFGGALALLLLAYRSMPVGAFPLPEWAARLHHRGEGMPYGVAIAAGALMIFPQTAWQTLLAG